MSTFATSAAVLVHEDEPAARITLNRPEKRNALSLELMQVLIGTLRDVSAEPGVRVIVLEAAGSAFSAGHDLSEMIGRDVPFFQRLFDVCTELMETIHRVPQPVIAKVHGIATAAGCQLVATCDLAVATEDSRFATSGVRFGLFCSTPGVAVSRNLSRKHALEMLLTGRFVDAATAERWGLVNRVVPAGRLMDEAMALAEAIASKPPATLAIGKEAFYRQIEMNLGDAYDYAAGVMVQNMMHAESEEGIGAFLEKRTPVWDKG
jgi:enoyl-CoA hydratase/carnithine racemase